MALFYLSDDIYKLIFFLKSKVIVILIKTLFSFQSLGNHEFDDGVDGVVPFIRNLSSPILAANLNLNNVPDLQKEVNLHKSVILLKDNKKIGVIGYLTPETKFLAPKNDVIYEDEIIAIRGEVTKLKEKGVNIIIALGHSGFLKDLEIAREVDDIDLVIGGHSNTFMWNSNTTNEIPEIPQGPYPTIVVQKSGRLVPVVQAYAYTKYMGKLHLLFDNEGELTKYYGDPILLNNDIPNDPEILQIIKKYSSDIDRVNNEVVGSSLVLLDGEQCRLRECNMGNIITDAILDYTKEYFSDIYPGANVAVTQGGRIRTSLNRPEKPYKLTRGDWINVIPFTDTMTIVTMNGSVLMEALEHSVDTWRTIDAPGQFLQFSGMKVVYNLANPSGFRVQKAEAICSNCTELTEVKEKYEYKLIMSFFLANSGDGYTMFDNLSKEVLPYNEVTCILDYLNKHSPVQTKTEGRILVLNEDKVKTMTDSIHVSTSIDANKSLPSSSITNVGSCKLYSVLLSTLTFTYFLF